MFIGKFVDKSGRKAGGGKGTGFDSALQVKGRTGSIEGEKPPGNPEVVFRATFRPIVPRSPHTIWSIPPADVQPFAMLLPRLIRCLRAFFRSATPTYRVPGPNLGNLGDRS